MSVSSTKIEQVDKAYWGDHQVDGITFCRWMHQNGYYGFSSDADNALFTGFYLAAAAFRYGITKTSKDLEKINDTLDGIHLLTHVSGTPGVLVRLAFPLENAYRRIGYVPIATQPKPEGWRKGNTWWNRKSEGSVYESDTHFYYCRTTRDQLTGIVYGLSVAWNILSKNNNSNTIEKIKTITQDLVTRLEETDWSLEDHTGFVGDTNAHKPKDNLRDALILLNCDVNNKPRPSTKGLTRFYRFLWFYTIYYWFTRRMYAWNLRTAIAFSLWINESDPKLKAGAEKWIKRISVFTKDEDNAFFVFTENAMTNDVSQSRLDRAQERLDELAEVGHNRLFAWQKEKGKSTPAGTGGRYGPGVDVLLPYWLHKYAGDN